MRQTRCAVVALAVASAATAPARNAWSQMMATFEAPHAARTPTAVLDAQLTAQIDAQATQASVSTADALIAIALDVTAHALHFGLAHHTSLSFHPGEREGNCVEYAELFATVVNREHGSVDARAWVVRSDGRLFGQRLSDPAWKDHDWVLVTVRADGATRRLYVDPTLYDMGLAWDISRAVRGEVRLP